MQVATNEYDEAYLVHGYFTNQSLDIGGWTPDTFQDQVPRS